MIKGLQKTTTVDYPGKIACTIFFSGCNFRCGFCHNPSLVLDSKELKEYSEEEILEFLVKRKGLLDAVCLTGGEPTLYADLSLFAKRIKQLGFLVKLDTNGTKPEAIKQLLDKNLLDYIAMDVKSSFDEYEKACGAAVDIEKIRKSVKIIQDSGIDYEFRITVVPGLFNQETARKLGRDLAGSKRLILQQFINIGDMIDKGFNDVKPYALADLEKFREILKQYIKEVRIR